jgi:hypothetical protein
LLFFLYFRIHTGSHTRATKRGHSLNSPEQELGLPLFSRQLLDARHFTEANESAGCRNRANTKNEYQEIHKKPSEFNLPAERPSSL